MTNENDTAVFVDMQDFQSCTIPLPPLESPGAGQIDLWFLDLGGLAGSLRKALGGAPREGTANAHQLRFARRFYLRLLLGAYLGLPGKSVRINRKQRGKPVLDASVHDTSLHFSMAKSEDRLLIGFSTSSHIGVDLEPDGRRARDPLGLAQRYFSAAEARALAAMPAEDLDAAFLRTWACKEAVVKASGMGIANQFGRFTVETGLDRPATLLEFEGRPAADWTLAMVRPEKQFLGAVAIQQPVTRVRAFRLLPSGQSNP
jgi:4'-phosphopantetheinyl transferase